MQRDARPSIARILLDKRRTPPSAGYRELQDRTLHEREAMKRTRTYLYVSCALLAVIVYQAARFLTAVGE